jgi:hypothetical protein
MAKRKYMLWFVGLAFASAGSLPTNRRTRLAPSRFQVIRAFGVAFFFAVHEHDIGLDAPIGGQQNAAIPPSMPCLDSFREIHFAIGHPFGDTDQLRSLVASDVAHRALYQVFLDMRDAAAAILDNTTVADLVSAQESPRSKARHHYPQ